MIDSWEDHAWLLAVIAADKTGDLTELVARLRSNAPLSDDARELVAELLSRHKLQDLPGGRRRSPHEDINDDHINVITAATDYLEQCRETANGVMRWNGKRHSKSYLNELDRLAANYKGHHQSQAYQDKLKKLRQKVKYEKSDEAMARLAVEYDCDYDRLREYLKGKGSTNDIYPKAKLIQSMKDRGF